MVLLPSFIFAILHEILLVTYAKPLISDSRLKKISLLQFILLIFLQVTVKKCDDNFEIAKGLRGLNVKSSSKVILFFD